MRHLIWIRPGPLYQPISIKVKLPEVKCVNSMLYLETMGCQGRTNESTIMGRGPVYTCKIKTA